MTARRTNFRDPQVAALLDALQGRPLYASMTRTAIVTLALQHELAHAEKPNTLRAEVDALQQELAQLRQEVRG